MSEGFGELKCRRHFFMQDVYAAKGSKTFWLYSIGYYKKWGNSKNNIY